MRLADGASVVNFTVTAAAEDDDEPSAEASAEDTEASADPVDVSVETAQDAAEPTE